MIDALYMVVDKIKNDKQLGQELQGVLKNQDMTPNALAMRGSLY